MYKHILVSTDGSKLSRKAIRAAAKMAKAFDAKLTGTYVIAPYAPESYGEAALYLPELSPRRYKDMTAKEAKKALAVVEIEAQIAGVKFAAVPVTHAQPWKGIIGIAHSKKCDLIVMASHGRRGLSGLILGSETTKVLTHSKIPVLVYR